MLVVVLGNIGRPGWNRLESSLLANTEHCLRWCKHQHSIINNSKLCPISHCLLRQTIASSIHWQSIIARSASLASLVATKGG